MQHVCTLVMSDLDLRFRLTLTLKIMQHVCTLVMNDFRLNVQVDVNSKKQCSMCVHG